MDYKKITTLAAVFAALNLPADVKPDVSAWPARYHAHKQFEYDVQMAIDAINGPDWVADWNDTTQEKYVIWWWIIDKPERASGRGLAVGVVGCACSYTGVGPLLVFRSRKHAEHFAKHFLPLMESYYLG